MVIDAGMKLLAELVPKGTVIEVNPRYDSMSRKEKRMFKVFLVTRDGRPVRVEFSTDYRSLTAMAPGERAEFVCEATRVSGWMADALLDGASLGLFANTRHAAERFNKFMHDGGDAPAYAV